MKGWFEDNPLGVALASVAAALLLILLLLAVAWSLPPRAADPGDGEDGQGLDARVPELAPAPPIEQFAVINERPVFNESRRPEYPGDEEEAGAEGEEIAETVVDAPDVELSGVVITPSVRMATLKPKGAAESLIALEGSPLEGNYGSWQVSTVEPRSVVLRAGDGREVRLELQVHDRVIAEPPKPPPGMPATTQAGDAAGEDGQPLSRAEEIRQRIAERREELRRAQEENAPPPRPSYNNAIQQLIQGKRTEDENENPEEQ